MFWYLAFFWKSAITPSFLVLSVWNAVGVITCKIENVVTMLLKSCWNDVETLRNSKNRK